MRLPRLSRLLLAAAVGVSAAAPAVAEAQQPLLFGEWTPFEWFFAPGPVEGDGFSFVSTRTVRVRVTDTGFSGDAFSIFANGSQVALTPTVVSGLGSGAFDADDAWADPALSKIEFLLAPGRYTLSLAVRDASDGFTDGFGYLRADEVVTGTVPEPATVVLLAAGLAGVGLMTRRSRAKVG